LLKKAKMAPSSNSGQPERSPGAADLGQLPEPVVKAIEAFTTAAKTRRIENITEAYQALKSSANGMGLQHLLPIADKVLGKSALSLIVAAFSHEKCFMCQNGMVACEACEDEDAHTQAKCEHCNSTGQASCEFCAGTGWVGNDVIPHELQHAVWKSRLKHTHKLLEKYARLYNRVFLDDLSRRAMNDPQRHLAIVETIRLASKLRALIQSHAVVNPEHAKHLDTAEQKLRACLTMLSWK
jgi:hypothetical protein